MQKILIVEDDADIQDILKNHLIDAGYEVVVASDGVAGIAMFDDTINLILLDIMLPKIDGCSPLYTVASIVWILMYSEILITACVAAFSMMENSVSVRRMVIRCSRFMSVSFCGRVIQCSFLAS